MALNGDLRRYTDQTILCLEQALKVLRRGQQTGSHQSKKTLFFSLVCADLGAYSIGLIKTNNPWEYCPMSAYAFKKFNRSNDRPTIFPK